MLHYSPSRISVGNTLKIWHSSTLSITNIHTPISNQSCNGQDIRQRCRCSSQQRTCGRGEPPVGIVLVVIAAHVKYLPLQAYLIMMVCLMLRSLGLWRRVCLVPYYAMIIKPALISGRRFGSFITRMVWGWRDGMRRV